MALQEPQDTPLAPLENETSGTAPKGPDDDTWLTLARDAFTGSDDWFNNSIRKEVEKALSNFRSKHPAGSKYHSPYYEKRSRLFRPKTRSMVRGIEAAAAVAFFSTADALNCTAFNDADPRQKLAAEIHNLILNQRLSEPDMLWFLTVVGAAQEAATVGVVISRQTWEYESEIRDGANGSKIEVIKKDRPKCCLLPIENVRVSPAADWRNIVGTSPFFIEMEPRYVYEIKANMKKLDKDGQPIYRQLEDGMLHAAIKQDWDSIRQMREGKRVDKYDAMQPVSDYATVWVHHNIVQKDGEDWVYDTLGTQLMLSTAVKPLIEVYAHGLRPYTIGFMVPEVHKPYPSSPTMLTESLQEETNDLANLRIDNIRLALGKRFFVRRGAGVDTGSLVRNVAASVTFMGDTGRDVKELTTQDVTASSYAEQDRLNMDFDELAGRFSQSSIASNRKLNETVGGMSMLKEDSNQIQEYQIRVLAETWMEPTLRQFVALEAEYESDMEILSKVGAVLGLAPQDVVGLLRERVNVNVNVGFNATAPEKRIQKLTLGLATLAQFFPTAVQAADVPEIASEIFGALGYKDATRFLPALKKGAGEDPRVKALTDQVQQLTQLVQGRSLERQIDANARITIADINSKTALAIAQIRAEVDQIKLQAGSNTELYIVQLKNRLETIDRQIAIEDQDIRRRELYLQREALSHSITEADRQYALEVARHHVDSVAKLSGDLNTPKAPGADKSGTLGRDQYGAMPDSLMTA